MKGLLSSIVLLLTPALVHAKNDSGDYAGGITISVTYVLDQQHVHFQAADGSSAAVPSTPAPGGDGYDVLSSPPVTVGGQTVKFAGGVPKKRNADGTWTRIGRMKNSKRTGNLEEGSDDIRIYPPTKRGPGEDISSLPIPW